MRPLLIAASSGIVVICVQWWLARPAAKGVSWRLVAETPLATRLFQHELPAWDAVRVQWSRRQRREQSSTESTVTLQKTGRTVIESARDLDPNIARELKELVHRSGNLDLAGRRWFRLVESVNTATRQAGHPYYLDPRVVLFQSDAGLQTRFHLATYRVVAVRPATAQRRPYALLHVRQLGGPTGKEGRLLGLSRDAQPFALVDLGVVEKEVASLTEFMEDTCPGAQGRSVMFQACQLLSSLDQETLRDEIVSGTERHELEHQVDGPLLVIASPVLRRLPHVLKSDQDRVNRELSAYLAEMTGPGRAPRLGLFGLATMTRRSPSSTLYQVGVLGLEALVGEHLTGPGERIGETRAARIVTELSALNDDELRQRAAHAWRGLFRRRLPEVELGALERPPGPAAKLHSE